MNQSQRGYNHDRMCHLLYHSQNDLKIGTNPYESKLNGHKSGQCVAC